jgi:poly-gamma-glutamate synthesis protein (capsule biosynthesis protein)
MTAVSKAYSIAMMGDIMLDREVGRRFREDPSAFDFENIRRLLEPYDIIFANLENPVAQQGSPHPVQDPNVCFCAKPETLQILKNLGVNVVSIGNNHLLDYGTAALVETTHHLDDSGIHWAGAGQNYEEANRPVFITANSHKIAILSHVFIYSASTERADDRNPGLADYRIRPILKRIGNLKDEGFHVHVSLHWGIEYQFYPLPYQMKWARRMIDAGASLIIGHGPHYPQGFEDYNGGRIIYSLGNFIFDEPYKYTRRSLICGVAVSTKGQPIKTDIYPVHLENALPRIVTGRERERIVNLVNCLTERYPQLDRTFWQRINNIWFSDIVWRIQKMKSWKFAFLPPLSFYFSLGIKNYLRKFLPGRMKKWIK